MSKQSRRPNRAARHQVPPVGKQPRRKQTNLLVAVGVAAIAAALLAAATLMGGGNTSASNAPLVVGKKAPEFVGRDVLSGNEVSSSTLAGRNVLYFFNEGVMCQACLVQIQALEQHVADLEQRRLTLVSITNDDAGTLRQAGLDYKLTTPLVADQSTELTKRFGALGGGMHSDTADHTFILVDRNGIVRYDKDFPTMWIDPERLLDQLPNI